MVVTTGASSSPFAGAARSGLAAWPALVRASVELVDESGMVVEQPTVDFPIDENLIAELNAARFTG